MTKRPVALVAFQEQDNLGVGYIASAVMEAGYEILMIDFRIGSEKIIEKLLETDPLIVGFSVIFQHHIHLFKDLIQDIREKGVTCHFTAGGHYPSLRPHELLEMIPEIDTIVLFEGEITFVELVKTIDSGGDWSQIKGIAWSANGRFHQTPLRPLVEDLDHFMPPVRQSLREYAFGKKYATLLAGRGCVHNCSFCSIREFYSQPPGPVKRIRRPEMVAREMELLHQEMGCSVFMFQDDDFPVPRSERDPWSREFCARLADNGLHEKILWKINCRPDEVSRESFSHMKEHGLFLVYLGIESGTDKGLKLMDKRITPEENLSAVQIIKDLDIVYDYGFMLFEPMSTFDSIAANISFLDKLCGDGSSPITFCKMLPYAGTRIEKKLKAENRLLGPVGFETYNFLDERLDHLYAFMAECFSDWIGEHDGVLNLARWTRYFLAVYEKYYGRDADYSHAKARTREMISDSNGFFLRTAEIATKLFESEGSPRTTELNDLKKQIADRHGQFQTAFNGLLNDIERLPKPGCTPPLR